MASNEQEESLRLATLCQRLGRLCSEKEVEIWDEEPPSGKVAAVSFNFSWDYLLQSICQSASFPKYHEAGMADRPSQDILEGCRTVHCKI